MTEVAIHSQPPPPGIGLLMWTRYRDLRNRSSQAIREAPLRLISTAVFLLLIWASLYLFFQVIFDRMQQNMFIESVVAIPLIFHFFFVALTVMLIFSNGVLMHGALFTRGEADYLYSSPIRPEHIVLMKFIESLAFSSWSLLLLGLPLMMAVARSFEEPGAFCALFLGLFVCFVPIPGAIGLFCAWAAGMWLPRSARRVLVGAGFVIAGIVLIWFAVTWRNLNAGSANWLDAFMSRMSLIKSVLLPSTWVTHGIDHAIRGQLADSAFYLFVTASNALFWSWLAIVVVGPRALTAYARVQSASAPVRTRSAWRANAARYPRLARARESAGKIALFYLPDPLRHIVYKDLKSFLRDPLQWSQLAILFGLMALYVVNIPTINPDLQSENTQRLISFLNLAAVSLILATFTSRFVFPLISLEGQQLWLISLLPVSRRQLLWAKFVFALIVTLGCAMLVMGLAVRMLDLPISLAVMQLAVTTAACVALCGMSVGIGAILPVFNQRNPTRIASGFGGTLNLLLSVLYIALLLAGMCWIMVFRRATDAAGNPLPILGRWDAPDYFALAVVAGLILFSISVAVLAMIAGARKFERAEL